MSRHDDCPPQQIFPPKVVTVPAIAVIHRSMAKERVLTSEKSPIMRLLFAATLLVLCLTGALGAKANEVPFDTWLEGVKTEARQKGIKDSTIETVLTPLKPIDRVLELDKAQPEFTLSFQDYLAKTVSKGRTSTGRRMMAEHSALLKKVSAAYKVQPRFIVAFWGIETDYGRGMGGFSVPAALATLAWEGRRATFFRDELFNALKIIDDGDIAPGDMIGSWAGAMGQSQFMPSSFQRFAVDFDGDKKRDIWNSYADVFASIANYLSQSGWRDDETWGRRIKLPKGFDKTLISLDTKKSLTGWAALGVRRADGHALPKSSAQGSLVQAGDNGPIFIVYDNYRTTLLWNRSTYFALAVGHLADAITTGS
jgi:membrane-bound lytic murein transglycosylase B